MSSVGLGTSSFSLAQASTLIPVGTDARDLMHLRGPLALANFPPPLLPVYTYPLTPPSETPAAVQVLDDLIRVIMQDPDGFWESIPTVCAEHKIDPTVLRSLAQNLISARLVINPPKDP